MIWQDMVIGVGQFIFGLALLPSLLGKHKPDWRTSFMTGSLLILFAGTYWSLGMLLATAACIWCGALWLALALQVASNTKMP